MTPKTKYQVLSLECLQAIERAFVDGCDITVARHYRTLEAIREAIAVAERYHPNEYIVLGRAVFQRNERQARRERARRLEEIVQQFGFSIVPVRANGKVKSWTIGIGDLDDKGNDTVCSAKTLHEAIAEASAKQLQLRMAKETKPLMSIRHAHC